MSAKDQQISLARVLIALAWSDGEISHEEKNFLKDFLFKFDFTGEEWARIEMYMEDPVTPEESEALVRHFLENLGSRGDRQEVLSALEGLRDADGATAEEGLFLKRFSELMRETSSTSALLKNLGGLFKRTVFKPVAGSSRSEELDIFLNNRILFKIRRKLEREKLAIEAHPDELAYAALFAGLMAHVASVHRPLGEKEIALLGSHLKQLARFDDEATEVILSVIQESAAKGLDRFRLTRRFFEKSTRQQRQELLDCLFDIAGSDTDLHHSEVEEVRAVAYALKMSHREFIDAKMRYLDKNRASN